MSFVIKKTKSILEFIVFAHDLRTKDETKEFKIKAKSKDEALKFFSEDFPQSYWYIQEVELV